LFKSWQHTYRAHGCELPLELWAANVGGYNYDVFDPLDWLEKEYGAPIDKESVNAARRVCYLLQVNQQNAICGAREAIAAVKATGVKLAVVSSSSRNWVPVHLKRLGLYDFFDVIVCGDEVENVKPDPALYKLALDRLGIKAAHAFAVEDSPKGIAAARAASLYCVAVPNPVTRASRLTGYNKMLDSLEEYPFNTIIAEITAELFGNS
ncbi:MAG: HAD-IA family hydrolase, partial [Candidatus Hydrogenedentes bacterium]|nr:HAD-IA family hydrolase [Candidatus Hydrogenedentota bacterium]